MTVLSKDESKKLESLIATIFKDDEAKLLNAFMNSIYVQKVSSDPVNGKVTPINQTILGLFHQPDKQELNNLRTGLGKEIKNLIEARNKAIYEKVVEILNDDEVLTLEKLSKTSIYIDFRKTINAKGQMK